MPTNYDISPTEPLPGLHLDGTVTRRFLISYPVPPESLDRFLLPGGELATHGGVAWVSACFVNIKNMRLSIAPAEVGIGFNYLIHRTLAYLPYPDGKKRKSVLVLEPNINRKLFSSLGRMTAGVRFLFTDIKLAKRPESWTILMQDASGMPLFEAEISRSSIKPELPYGSRFSSLEEADRFLLGVAYGAEWHQDSGQLRLFAETHDPWQACVGTCITGRNAFLEGIGQCPEADHVITMAQVPHSFAMFGEDIRL